MLFRRAKKVHPDPGIDPYKFSPLLLFRGVSHFPLGKMGHTITFTGGTVMHCQKLKTYMETGRVVFVPERSIRPNPAQPRKIFKEETLKELSDSIRQHGILQPLSVRRIGNSYELIAGERRLRAARMAGLTEIPCIVMTMDEKESGLAAMIENLQRQDLDFIEESRGIAWLMEHWTMSQEQAAHLLGKSQSAIANKLRLLRHSEQVLDAIRQGGLTERHARALLRLRNELEKLQAIATIVELGMSVARAERYIDQILNGTQEKKTSPNLALFLNNISQSLARFQLSGISAVSERRETESEIVLTITIPKNQT
jgi:ParB family chromosome partitioning protein